MKDEDDGNIYISLIKQWEAFCHVDDCGWSVEDFDREDVVKAARKHRREEHKGCGIIRARFARGRVTPGEPI